jgi:fatty acid desaturase
MTIVKKDLSRSDILALKLLIIPVFSAVIFFSSLVFGNNLTYLFTLPFGVLFFTQTFFLIHECGHLSFFKKKKFNIFFGHFISVFTLIPFISWREIHGLHHKWTGFRDKDPTTEKTFDDRLSPFQTWLINFSWKFYIPLFTLGYRFGIYWKLEKLKRHLDEKSYKRCKLNMLFLVFGYASLIIANPLFTLKCVLAMIISFIFTDLISLSQHSHIRMKHSDGRDVEPLKYIDQTVYSRTLIFPSNVEYYLLFNFNNHESHHAYPGLPCYRLKEVDIKLENAFKFFPWLKKVKSISGVEFIFKSSEHRDGF